MIHKFQLLLSVTASLIYALVKWHSVIRREQEKANNKGILHLTCRLHLACEGFLCFDFMCIILVYASNLNKFGLSIRVVLRKLSSQPPARMLLCLLSVSMKTSTNQSSTLCPMLAAPPTALLPLLRFFCFIPSCFYFLDVLTT